MAATKQWRPSEAQKELRAAIRRQRAADRKAAQRRYMKSIAAKKEAEDK